MKINSKTTKNNPKKLMKKRILKSERESQLLILPFVFIASFQFIVLQKKTKHSALFFLTHFVELRDSIRCGSVTI